MKYLSLLVLVIIACSVTARQVDMSTANVRGHLNTWSSNGPLFDATVVLLLTLDSSVVKATHTDKNGAFEFKKLYKGEYDIRITYVGYVPVWRRFKVSEIDTLIDVGVISIKEQGITLDVIEVTSAKPSMTVKGDTIEFNADAFRTNENTVLEELLKRLPGIQVNMDGSIVMNGEAVRRLLVNGKVFFGSDPKTATRNLSVDIIDKVQFIDRKSEWSRFTGINDGQTEKTINITIKKSAENMYFGRASIAAGTGDHFAVNGNINKFDDEQQLAVWVHGSDISGYQDDGGQGRISIGGNSTVRNWDVGGSYSKDLGGKLKIGGDYIINDNYVEDKRNIERLNILPDTNWYYRQNNIEANKNSNHALNVSLEYKPDTVNMLNISASFGIGIGNSLQENTYASLTGGQRLVNTGNSHVEGDIQTSNISIGMFYGRKFRKIGRTLSVNLGSGYNRSDQKSINRSSNVFIELDGDIFADSIDQLNNVGGLNRSMSLSMIYTEPLVKNHYLQVIYAYSHTYNLSTKFTYDYNSSKGEYDFLNDSLSNIFKNGLVVQRVGMKMLTKGSSYDYNIGLNIQFNKMNNNNISESNRLLQRTINFLPSAVFNYIISRRKRVQFSYSGSTQQPASAQLQPVPDNSNPLHIFQGNPDLRPAFSNYFNISYTAYNAITLRNLSLGIGSGFTTNKIVDASWFDSLGRQVSQPRNINGSYRLNGGISTNFSLKSLKTFINSSVSIGFNQDVSYINGSKGFARSINIAPNMSFNYNYKELFGLSLNTNASYSRVRYSIQKENDTWFLNYRVALDGSINFPFGVVVGGSFDYVQNKAKKGQSSQDLAVLNGLISKSIFKHRRGLIRLQGFDLLNRNVGINRAVGADYIEDIRTTVIRRFFLVSFSLFITKSELRK